MKRTLSNLAVLDATYLDEDEVAIPYRLNAVDLKALTVDIAGFTFIRTGNVLACPKCGVVSGIGAVEALDKQVDFFLKFGCAHYKNDKTPQEALPEPAEETANPKDK